MQQQVRSFALTKVVTVSGQLPVQLPLGFHHALFVLCIPFATQRLRAPGHSLRRFGRQNVTEFSDPRLSARICTATVPYYKHKNTYYTEEVSVMNMPTLLQDQGLSQDVVSAMDAIVSFRHQGIRQTRRDAIAATQASSGADPRPRYCTFGGSLSKPTAESR